MAILGRRSWGAVWAAGNSRLRLQAEVEVEGPLALLRSATSVNAELLGGMTWAR